MIIKTKKLIKKIVGKKNFKEKVKRKKKISFKQKKFH